MSVPLIRAWERRYGVVNPKRTPSGYRLYDDDAIATLVHVRELTESGWSASEASRAILAGEVTSATAAVSTLPTALGADGHRHRESLVARFVAAATDMDIAATSAALDEIFAQGSFESIVDEMLMPALVQMGQAWSDGHLDVAAEHAASAAVYRRLAALYEAAATTGDAAVLVGLPPGARHELGALAYSVAVRRRGVGVLYLGPDVPIASWVSVIQRNRARVAVIAIVQRADQAGAIAVAEALRADGSSPVLAVGGRYAHWDGATESGIITMPDRINDAAAFTARLVAGAAAETGNHRGARA